MSASDEDEMNDALDEFEEALDAELEAFETRDALDERNPLATVDGEETLCALLSAWRHGDGYDRSVIGWLMTIGYHTGRLSS